MRRMARLEGLLSARGLVALALLAPIPPLLLSLAPRARLERADFTFNNGGELNSATRSAVSSDSTSSRGVPGAGRKIAIERPSHK